MHSSISCQNKKYSAKNVDFGYTGQYKGCDCQKLYIDETTQFHTAFLKGKRKTLSGDVILTEPESVKCAKDKFIFKFNPEKTIHDQDPRGQLGIKRRQQYYRQILVDYCNNNPYACSKVDETGFPQDPKSICNKYLNMCDRGMNFTEIPSTTLKYFATFTELLKGISQEGFRQLIKPKTREEQANLDRIIEIKHKMKELIENYNKNHEKQRLEKVEECKDIFGEGKKQEKAEKKTKKVEREDAKKREKLLKGGATAEQPLSNQKPPTDPNKTKKPTTHKLKKDCGCYKLSWDTAYHKFTNYNEKLKTSEKYVGTNKVKKYREEIKKCFSEVEWKQFEDYENLRQEMVSLKGPIQDFAKSWRKLKRTVKAEKELSKRMRQKTWKDVKNTGADIGKGAELAGKAGKAVLWNAPKAVLYNAPKSLGKKALEGAERRRISKTRKGKGPGLFSPGLGPGPEGSVFEDDLKPGTKPSHKMARIKSGALSGVKKTSKSGWNALKFVIE